MSLKLQRPAIVEALEVPDGPWTFPLKLEYDLANYTLEGRKQFVRYYEPTPFEVLW